MKQREINMKSNIMSPKYKSDDIKEKVLGEALHHVLLSGGKESKRLNEIELKNNSLMQEISSLPWNNSWDQQIQLERQRKLMYSNATVVSLANK